MSATKVRCFGCRKPLQEWEPIYEDALARWWCADCTIRANANREADQ